MQQGADVMQHSGRVPAEPVGQLFVGQRLVQAEPEDPQAEHAGQGPALGIGGAAGYRTPGVAQRVAPSPLVALESAAVGVTCRCSASTTPPANRSRFRRIAYRLSANSVRPGTPIDNSQSVSKTRRVPTAGTDSSAPIPEDPGDPAQSR